jgi:hypothetical protein
MSCFLGLSWPERLQFDVLEFLKLPEEIFEQRQGEVPIGRFVLVFIDIQAYFFGFLMEGESEVALIVVGEVVNQLGKFDCEGVVVEMVFVSFFEG